MRIGFYADSAAVGERPEVELLEEVGCGRIFGPGDRLSEDVIEFLRPGDTIVVTHLSRLAKSLESLIVLIERLQTMGVSVHAIQNQIVPGTPVGDAFGQACSILAEFQRSTKTESRDKRGRKGRPIVLNPEDQVRAERLLKRASVLEVARLLKVSPATIYRYFPRRRSGAGGHTEADKSSKSR